MNTQIPMQRVLQNCPSAGVKHFVLLAGYFWTDCMFLVLKVSFTCSSFLPFWHLAYTCMSGIGFKNVHFFSFFVFSFFLFFFGGGVRGGWQWMVVVVDFRKAFLLSCKISLPFLESLQDIFPAFFQFTNEFTQIQIIKRTWSSNNSVFQLACYPRETKGCLVMLCVLIYHQNIFSSVHQPQ